ncbi:MAG: fatty acid desaturase, partial [Nocardioides sp.]|nr:fatty acid desaturase [Nocardioides sp.]
ETRGDWYLRQMLGAANIDGGRLLHIMTGNLSFQVEHHLFPDLPSNRYQEIAPQIQEIFERYGLTYVTGSLPRQVGSAWKKVFRLSLPNDFLATTNAKNLPSQLKVLFAMTTKGPKVRRAAQARLTQQARRLKVSAAA